VGGEKRKEGGGKLGEGEGGKECRGLWDRVVTRVGVGLERR